MGLYTNKCLRSKNLHLAVSVVLIAIVGLAYGVHPEVMMPWLFDFKVTSIDLFHILRAQMGLYIAMSCLWSMGIVRAKFWFTATITNIVFMGGLASGRLLSLAFDGTPSLYFLIGLILEFTLAFWGYMNLKKYKF